VCVFVCVFSFIFCIIWGFIYSCKYFIYHSLITMSSSIKKIYFNPRLSGSYSGFASFYNNRHLKLPKEEVEKELLKLKEYYLFRKALKKFPKRKVMAFLPNWVISADLLDVSKYSNHNNGNRYIVVAIDNFSKRLYTHPIKTKSSDNMIRAFKNLFKQMAQLPRYFTSDSGSEFTSQSFQSFLKSKNIIWFTVQNHSPIVERVIATLMSKLVRLFTHYHNTRYLGHLKLITNSYNSSVHSSTGYAPNAINEENQAIAFRNLHKSLLKNGGYHDERRGQKFHSGQDVRISLAKQVFEKVMIF
jgi:hypothetical protein